MTTLTSDRSYLYLVMAFMVSGFAALRLANSKTSTCADYREKTTLLNAYIVHNEMLAPYRILTVYKQIPTKNNRKPASQQTLSVRRELQNFMQTKT